MCVYKIVSRCKFLEYGRSYHNPSQKCEVNI